jgi:hypothetical protein
MNLKNHFVIVDEFYFMNEAMKTVCHIFRRQSANEA